MQSVSLSKSPKEKPVIVADITGDPELCYRLEEIGFVPGSSVEVIAKLPFNGPIACKIRGANYALRREDADAILVTDYSEYSRN